MDLNLNNYLVNNEVPKYVRLEKIAQRKKIVNHHDQAQGEPINVMSETNKHNIVRDLKYLHLYFIISTGSGLSFTEYS